jgi:Subtilase family
MRVSVMEWGWLDDARTMPNHITKAHYGFGVAGSTSTHRFSNIRFCSSSTCVSEMSSPEPRSGTHGSVVTGVLGGSIEAGQDPGFPTPTSAFLPTLSQRKRSFVAPNELLNYYRVDSCEGISMALQAALFDQGPVTNASFQFGLNADGMLADCAGLNADIHNFATFSGVLVFAAGNEGVAGIPYPIMRPEVIAVGAVDSDTTIPYGSTPIGSNSSYQAFSLPLGGGSGLHRPVQVVAPQVMTLIPHTSPNQYWGNSGGTSMPAPVVSGIAALLRDVYGVPAGPGWKVQAAVLAMGDGFNPGQSTMTTGTSVQAGAGHVFARYPRAQSFGGAAWFWDSLAVNLAGAGSVACVPLNAGSPLPTLSQWKMGATWDEPNTVTAAADIDFWVRDVVSGVTLASQTDYNIFNRMRLAGSAVSGKRLELCATAYTSPGPRTVYITHFGHNDGAD